MVIKQNLSEFMMPTQDKTQEKQSLNFSAKTVFIKAGDFLHILCLFS